MNASLERFYRQFTEQYGTVSQVLDAIADKSFRLFIPTPASEDQPGTIERIKKTLPHIANVVRKPYVTLRTDMTQVRAERAGVLSPAGIRATISDGRIWKRRGDEVRPEYVYATTHEDDCNSYENRLVKTLIDRLIRFMRVPLRTAKESIPSLYAAYFQLSHLNKLDFMKFMRTDTFQQAKAQTYEDFAALLQLKTRIGTFRQSNFYKTMDKYPAFTGSPELTNLLTHNEDYRRCAELWNFLDTLGADAPTTGEAQSRNAYAMFIFFGMLNAYLGLGFTLKNDPPILISERAVRIPAATVENDDFTVDVWLPQDECMQLTVRAKETKRKEKYRVYLVRDTEIEPQPDADFYVSLYPTPYSDIASCVVPNNLNSIQDLTSIARITVLTFAVVFAGLFVTSVWRDIKRTAIPAEGMGRLVVYEYRTGLYDAATLFYVNENGGVSMVDTNLRVLLGPDSAVPDAYCYSKGYGSVSAEGGTIYLYGVSGDGTRVREFTVNTEKYRGVFTWFEFFLLAVSASVIIPGTVFLVSACRRRKALSPPKPVKRGAEPSPAE